jgi:hypothetical protein
MEPYIYSSTFYAWDEIPCTSALHDISSTAVFHPLPRNWSATFYKLLQDEFRSSDYRMFCEMVLQCGGSKT